MNELFSITAVAEETGIHQSRLRRWESMGFIKPRRVSLGSQSVRMYDEDQISFLLKIKELIDDGINLKTAFDWAEGNYE